MRYHLRITRILILFYLLGSFASATHIHQDATEVHLDCKVCHLSNTMHGGDVVAEPLQIVILPRYILPLALLQQKNINPLIKGYNAQAPPFSSFS